MLNRLFFGFGRRLPIVMQSESAECGLACLAMIAGYHGYRSDMLALRQTLGISLKGATLKNIISMGAQLGLTGRALKLDLSGLDKLRTPCILHWDFNHFVVLKKVTAKGAVIHDPAHGVRRLTLQQISDSFTGVALEIWPDGSFKEEETAPRPSIWRRLGPISGLGGTLTQIVLLALALEFCAVLSPFYLQTVVDKVLVNGDVDLLVVLAVGFALLLVMQQVFSLGRAWALMYIGTLLSVQWRVNIFRHLLGLPNDYFERRHLGDVVSRFGSIDVIQRTLTTSFVEALLDGVMTIVTLTLMFIYSPSLALIAVGAMVLYGLLRWACFAALRRANEDELVHTARQQTSFLETVRGVKTLKLFGRKQERVGVWSGLLIEQLNAGLRGQKQQIVFRTVNTLLFGLVTIIIIWQGAKLVLQGGLTVGMLLAFNAYKEQFNTRVAGLIDKSVEVMMLRLHSDRLSDIVLQQAEEDPEQNAEPPTETAGPPRVEVQHASFRFSSYEPYVLQDISLVIEPGESVAIVGPSGCGKTTLLNLMLGILSPSDGRILIDGVEIKESGLSYLRAISATVLQDDVLFAGSIADNISFFDVDADRQWVEECARLAAIHEDIAQMPMGYNTLVGDMGSVLSGGQKQRVLLARALYKRPRLLFLDEATSHLDVEKERLVSQTLQAMTMTRIIVAHRPETIRTVQRVIVLSGGRVAHSGPVPALADAPRGTDGESSV